ncbi:ROK family sugar kinase or transcriptional regulator [hydrothermal vent metagenome]|uniref:ROK family sugar kinase or transcriptional regulator n=1 Tax=hydrothermal vent metagenome TaxID=652676 RepID=A0A3B0URE3_9ZZZZ
MERMILACDFGGTKLSAAVVKTATSTGSVQAVLQQPSPVWHKQLQQSSSKRATAVTDIEMMIGMGRELLMGKRPFAIGISFGGPVDYKTGIVRLSHHVPGWENVPLRQRFAQEFDAPVHVDNDANVAALGEWHFGAGRGAAHLLYITVSTGVGGGWILNERPYRGADGMAGEIGHTVVDPNGPLCLCGKRGCVERLASGPYMAQDVAAQLGLPSGSVTGKMVVKMAEEGVETAVAILERGARGLGVGIGNAANLLNPSCVLLGGGVTKSGERWWQLVRQAAKATALPEVHFEILPAALGDDAPLWGAVALVHMKM